VVCCVDADAGRSVNRILVALFVVFVLGAPISAASFPDAQYQLVESAASPASANGPITITAGGTYSGSWTSMNSAPAVRISTSEPVTITNSTVTNRGGGVLIESAFLAANVTIDHVFGYGRTGRFFSGRNFKSITIRNCTIDKSGGIHLITPVAGASVLVTENKQLNVQKGEGLRQFLQLGEVQDATVEISWNEIINEFGKSEVEDVISVYKSAHARIHDNYLQGGYPLTNVAWSSANGITVEVGDGIGPTSFDNEIWNNIVVDNVGGIGLVGGHDNYAHHNWIVQDGRLDRDAIPRRSRSGPVRGDPVLLAANLGLAVWNLGGFPGFANNRARYNLVGFVRANGRRNDFWLPGAPGDYALNKSMPGRVTRNTEVSAWTVWRIKLAANGKRVGA